jgi:genome maintenance exonuclease 1
MADYKQTNKPKKAEWVEDYKLQMVAYMLAHNEVYGTDIRRGVVFMCSRGNDPVQIGGEQYQQFDLYPDEFEKYRDMWLDKVQDYYDNYHD